MTICAGTGHGAKHREEVSDTHRVAVTLFLARRYHQGINATRREGWTLAGDSGHLARYQDSLGMKFNWGSHPRKWARAGCWPTNWVGMDSPVRPNG